MKKILLVLSLVLMMMLTAQGALGASATVEKVLVSTKDCTSPPASTYLNPCSPATSFKVGQQVWHCVKLKTLEGGGAINVKFYVDGLLKKTNSIPGYPSPMQYQIRCDYYKAYTNADVGIHTFKGGVSPCSGETCSLSTKFRIIK